MDNKTYKIMQYADDTQMFSMLNFESLQARLITFGEYSAVSGLKINFDKSEVLKIGSARKKRWLYRNKSISTFGQKATKCIRYTGYPRTGKSGKHEYYTSGAKNRQYNKNIGSTKINPIWQNYNYKVTTRITADI